MDKLKSRKFWISVAACLASIGSAIAGIATDNEIIVAVGIGCTVIAGGIYAGAEAYVDGKYAASSQTVVSTNINANTTSGAKVKEVTEAAKEAANG